MAGRVLVGGENEKDQRKERSRQQIKITVLDKDDTSE
jgi:hypothetical protein